MAAADLAQRLHVAIQAGQPETGRAGVAGGLASIACILVGAETGVRLADFLIEVTEWLVYRNSSSRRDVVLLSAWCAQC